MRRQLRAVQLIPAAQLRWIILFFSVLLALVAFRRLLVGLYYVSGKAGYDFRYFWVAGRMWLEGKDPYALADYKTFGSAIITEGHVPDFWVYPPSWWPFSSLLALADLKSANIVWNVAAIGLCFGASFLVVSAFQWAHSDPTSKPSYRNFLAGATITLPLLHFFGVAELEATTLTIGTGQNSLFVYFGIAALLYGIAKGSRAVSALALSIILLKPQVGLPFAALFLVYSRWSRQVLSGVLALTFILALPALLIQPLVPLEMIQNMQVYGEFKRNFPQTMTGLRLCLWELFGVESGNVPAIIAALASGAGALALKRLHRRDDRRILWLCAIVTTAITVALAPLHFYDFVVIGVLFPAVLVSPAPSIGAAVLGAALIIRADTLGKVTGLYDPAVGIFEGSILSTIGALLLLVAALSASSRSAFGKRAD